VIKGNRIWTALAVGAVLACGGKSSTGPGGGSNSAVAGDATGDTYGVNAVQWDITSLGVSRDANSITVTIDFTANVLAPFNLDTTAMIGFVDFDVDQDSTTGAFSVVDGNRPGAGSTGIGVDYELDLAFFESDSSFDVLDSLGNVTGTVRATYNAKRVTVVIPRSLLGNDDGFLNAAAIVGTYPEPTDIVPENGHLSLSASPVAPYSPVAAGTAVSGGALRRGWRHSPLQASRRTRSP
jgi:hypothetical protein